MKRHTRYHQRRLFAVQLSLILLTVHRIAYLLDVLLTRIILRSCARNLRARVLVDALSCVTHLL